MGALGHYLEAGGIATTGISLVREHTEAIRPPRALWVPFMLGRPFGAPDQPALQRRVLLAALKLLAGGPGPLLAHFPEDAPASAPEHELEGLACPVSFAPPDAGDDPLERLLAEIRQLQPWHDMAMRPSGRGGSALTGLGVEQLARFAASFLGASPSPSYDTHLSGAEALKRVCDDLKAFYVAAAGAQPGGADPAALERWFWRETAAGSLFLELRNACMRSADPGLQALGAMALVPRVILAELGR